MIQKLKETKTREDIRQDRARRKRMLIGKYIIVCIGKSQVIYLQDQRLSRSSYWTNYIENSITFLDVDEAIKECGKLKYNKPKVCIVKNNYVLEQVKK